MEMINPSDYHVHECTYCGTRWMHTQALVKAHHVNIEAHTCPECDSLIQSAPMRPDHYPLHYNEYYGKGHPLNTQGTAP